MRKLYVFVFAFVLSTLCTLPALAQPVRYYYNIQSSNPLTGMAAPGKLPAMPDDQTQWGILLLIDSPNASIDRYIIEVVVEKDSGGKLAIHQELKRQPVIPGLPTWSADTVWVSNKPDFKVLSIAITPEVRSRLETVVVDSPKPATIYESKSLTAGK